MRGKPGDSARGQPYAGDEQRLAIHCRLVTAHHALLSPLSEQDQGAGEKRERPLIAEVPKTAEFGLVVWRSLERLTTNNGHPAAISPRWKPSCTDRGCGRLVSPTATALPGLVRS